MILNRTLPWLLVLPFVGPSLCSPTLAAKPPGFNAAPPATMAEGHRLRDSGRLTEALNVFERVLANDPGDSGAYKMRAMTLADLGSSQLAYEAVQREPQLFNAEERERIEGDRIARRINWGATLQQDSTSPLEEAAQALSELRALQEQSPRTTAGEANRLRIDALTALNQLQRHRDVVDDYEALIAEGVEVPAYALPAVGDSLLALRRPEDATEALEIALQHDPGNARTRILLGYAWLEREDHGRAMSYFSELSVTERAWPRRAGAASGYENWDKYSADTNLALARAFGNDTPGAEAALAALASVGPNNGSLQAMIGSVQGIRGRPDAARERFDMALTIDPHLRSAREGRAENWLRLAQPDLATGEFAELRVEAPHDPRLDRLDTVIDRYRSWQFESGASRSRSRAAGASDPISPFGSRDGEVSFALRSPLLDDRWRISLVGRDAWADFAGERVRDRRLGIGGTYRYDRLGAWMYATRVLDEYDDGGLGLDVGFDWRHSDAWSSRLALRRNDPEALLQARRFGITADSANLGATWTPSDHTLLDIRAARFSYDDGNRRDLVSADLAQRVASRPHWTVDGLFGAAYSRASKGVEAPYFNPSHDASLQLGARVWNVAWRRYERAFRQMVEARIGPYRQDGHGTRWVPSLAYRHAWNLAHGSRLEYGVDWSRPIYDGQRERRGGFDITYRWGSAP